MKLQSLIDQYVAFKRSLGYRFKTNENILRWFRRSVGDKKELEDITVEAVIGFLDGNGPVTRTWHVKYNALIGLYRYALGHGYIHESPLPLTIPKMPPTITPYIYSQEEIKRILSAADAYQKNRSSIEPITVRTIILLIYGAGLRPSEAVSILREDVDLSERLIIVRDSKCGKSRIVPISDQLTDELLKYVRHKRRNGQSLDSGPFFTLCTGKAVNLDTLRGIFQRVRSLAEIHRADGAKYQPRLHDLRHSFAVHRILTWYKEGKDVQKLLHPLSVYLGHVYLADTQVYLSVTPELLALANSQFEQYALEGSHHEAN